MSETTRSTMDTQAKLPIIVQCAREIRPGGGVSAVAHHLEEAFKRLGYPCERYSLQESGFDVVNGSGSLLATKLGLLRDVLVYSLWGTWRIRRRYRGKPGYVVVCHNDALYGDIYVNHGLHKALVKQHANKWKLLLRNPLHLFLLLREELRHRLGIHGKIVCFSQADKIDFLQCYRLASGKIHTIPNGVDVDKFQPSLATRQAKRLETRLGEQDFVLLFVGHEFERKGLRYAIQSLNYLPHQVRLWVLGGNTQQINAYQNLARQESISDRVRFWGARYDTPAFLNAADALVLPSAFEAWPLVGLEAMACGCPALMTAVGGVPEFLQEAENGFFIQQDPEDIAHKVRRLLEDQTLRKQIGGKARETALQYSWEQITQQYLNLIESVLQEREKNVKSRLCAV